MSRNAKIAVNVLVTIATLAWLVCSIMMVGSRSEKNVVTHYNVIVSDSAEVKFVSSENIIAMLKDSIAPLAMMIDSINLNDIERRIGSMDCIENVQVSSTSNGGIVIKIKQRRAVMRLMGECGEDFYVDSSMHQIMPRKGYRPKVPTISGELSETITTIDQEGKSVEKREIPLQFLKKIHTFVKLIADDNFYDNFVEQIYVKRDANSQKVSITIIPRVGTATINFGELEKMSVKLEKIKTFYTQAYKYAGVDKAKIIDVRFDSQVIVRNKSE